jgi:hypothetical protein
MTDSITLSQRKPPGKRTVKEAYSDRSVEL